MFPQITWDLDFKWDPCNTLGKVWLYQLKAYYDVFNIFQADSFNDDSTSPEEADELTGVTGIWGYRDTAS
jgi:hypothetical protein